MPRAHKPKLPPAEFRRTSSQITTTFPLARRTLYAMAADGRITVWKLGSKNLYDIRQIEALIRPQDRRAS